MCNVNSKLHKEKWLRLYKTEKLKIHSNSELSTFHNTLIDKCWPEQQLPFMDFDVELNIISDDNIELNLYPIMRILENQRVRNQNDENLLESEKQEVI